MDPALLRQRQEFMKQAIRSMDKMQQIKKETGSSGGGAGAAASSSGGNSAAASLQFQQLQKAKKKKRPATQVSSVKDAAASSALALQNAANFSIMAKIVDYMRKRHLNQQHWGLSLPEVLEEMQIYDVTKKTQLWLQEALPQNPRLESESEGKFIYKPPHKVKNKVTMLALLKKHHSDGKGGILLSELSDCVANAEALAKSLGNQCICLPTQINKRKDIVLFFNDTETDYTLDEEFVQLWRLAGVEHLDEGKIEEYLQRHGLETARDLAPRKPVGTAGMAPKRKQPKKATQRVHNVHLEGVLEDYAED